MECLRHVVVAALHRRVVSETREETEKDLQALISASMNDERERARRERLLRHLQSTDKAEPMELAKYTLDREHSFAQMGSD